jgi:drug/metabolite transporter (DMT)-like permease
MNDRQAYATLLLVILFWAGNYPVGKLGVGDLGPLTLTGGRALLAGPLLLVVARLAAPLSRPLARADYIAFAVLGGTGLVTNTTL